MPSDREVDAAAEALWLDTATKFSKPAGFGKYDSLDRRVKDIWRMSARVALQAAERVRGTANGPA